ncbi:MAG TPA: DegT/DnrJ/EryC1/StrS family aminotransferase [Ilumatobacteraceae bacterium]|nr:DegT/DnrJ/EryC1/StrS family aminotransferase [Ilumatobacteraceae bacterium]
MNQSVVPFNDLSRSTPQESAGTMEAIQRVVQRGHYLLGPETEALESELSAYVGVAHSITCANGTDALRLAMLALGIGAGDVVLTAANAGGYSTIAARSIGARLAYADVDPATLLVSPDSLEAALVRTSTPLAAVVVTHLYGRCAPMTAIIEWAERRGIPVIEDAAQSLGALHQGRQSGSFGQISTTSFYPTKNLGALGDAGAVFTNSDKLNARVRALRQYGWAKKYHIGITGGVNSRIDEIQAAVLRDRLPRLDAMNERRRQIHRRYETAAAANADRVRLVNIASPEFVGHLAVIIVDHRDEAAQRFREAGVQTDVHYPVPDHRQSPFEASDAVSLPVTERAVTQILSIPLFPSLTDSEIDRVCQVLATL